MAEMRGTDNSLSSRIPVRIPTGILLTKAANFANTYIHITKMGLTFDGLKLSPKKTCSSLMIAKCYIHFFD